MAVLVDAEIGAAQIIAGGDLPGNTGLIISVEESGYTGDPTGRVSRVLPGWSVGKTRRMGASAVKLLVYYHPESRQAGEQEKLVSQVAETCARVDLPLFLEPLSYSPDPHRKKLSSAELRQVVVETARRLTPLGADILKAEFPLDIKEEPDEDAWEGLPEPDSGLTGPWVLPCRGRFRNLLRWSRLPAGWGQGVLAGRAIWKEAVDLSGPERLVFLRETAARRMERFAILRCAGLTLTACFLCPSQMAGTGSILICKPI
jgi:tagatose-1,6-bisphosphate aldolase